MDPCLLTQNKMILGTNADLVMFLKRTHKFFIALVKSHSSLPSILLPNGFLLSEDNQEQPNPALNLE